MKDVMIYEQRPPRVRVVIFETGMEDGWLYRDPADDTWKHALKARGEGQPKTIDCLPVVFNGLGFSPVSSGDFLILGMRGFDITKTPIHPEQLNALYQFVGMEANL